ncbi:MAG: tRNA (adenosine(37)-N6)-threonylcarbamoyltransferase complex dimerization subunit type 1 TsaB [Treponema sp.]|nr:tRNA (adenosine(37)-N6)-threonylcarbamoyltransferase complex dimerization subunit type 1 TsaB [Treponema sp.]
MNLLAIDTATSILSVALACKNEVYQFEADSPMKHSELIMDSIDMLMKKACLKPADLQGLLCMGGPGSFTGLRIGFSTAKGLALPLGIPFTAIPSLDCIASMSPGAGLVIPVIDAKKKSFYFALYLDGERLGPDMDAGPRQIAAAIRETVAAPCRPAEPPMVNLTGPDAQMLCDKLLEDDASLADSINFTVEPPRGYACGLIDLAKKNKLFDTTDPSWLFKGPEYIRKSDAELNLGGAPVP